MSRMKRQWDQSTQAFGEPPYVNETRQARKRKTEGEGKRKPATSPTSKYFVSRPFDPPRGDFSLEELERLQLKVQDRDRTEQEKREELEGLEGEALASKLLDCSPGLCRLTIDELCYLAEHLMSLLRLVSMTGEAVKAAPHSGACRNKDTRCMGECSRCVALGYYQRARGAARDV